MHLRLYSKHFWQKLEILLLAPKIGFPQEKLRDKPLTILHPCSLFYVSLEQSFLLLQNVGVHKYVLVMFIVGYNV